MADYVTDDELFDVAHRLAIRFAAIMPGGVDTSADVEAVVALDPRLIAEQHELVSDAATRLGNGETAELLALVQRSVGSWQGDAAEAFYRHTVRIEAFLENQRELMLEPVKTLLAAYELALQVRRGYRDLAEAVILAIGQFEAQREEQQVVVSVKILVAFVGGILTAVTGGVAALALGTLVAGGAALAETTDFVISAGDPQQLANEYRRGANELYAVMDAELQRLAEHNDGLEKEIRTVGDDEHELVEPLPVHTQVLSPDFRYERFASEHQPIGPFTPLVDQHRPQPPASPGYVPGRITDALTPGGR